MSCILNENEKTLIVAGYSEKQKKTLVFSHKDIIANYEEQAQTSEPHFIPRTRDENENNNIKGFLIWSLWDGGAGVCFKRENGSYYLLTGLQSDFCFSL